jgi:hypothetical protein
MLQVGAGPQQPDEEAWRDLAAEFRRISSLLRAEFRPATEPTLPDTADFHEAAALRAAEAAALEGVGRLLRAERAAARDRARESVADEKRQFDQQREAEEAALVELRRKWEDLKANDPETVLQVSGEALEEIDAWAGVVDVNVDEITVLHVVPSVAAIPLRYPERVSALIAPIQGLDELQRNGYYRTLVFGNLIVTLKEAFAVLPGVARIRTVVVRRTESALECLLAATFDRSRFVAANFGTDGAEQIIYQTHGSFCMEEIGRVGELLPLDPHDQPEIAALLEQITYVEEEQVGPERPMLTFRPNIFAWDETGQTEAEA